MIENNDCVPRRAYMLAEEKKCLIVNTQTSGHHLEYINWIYQYAHLVSCKIYLFVSNDAIEKLQLTDRDTLKVVPSPHMSGRLDQRRALKEIAVIDVFIRENGINELVFLNINPYQSLLARGYFSSGNLCVRGILFSPPHRIVPHCSDSLLLKAKLKWKRLRKFLQLRVLVRNKSMKRIFVLDDEQGSLRLSEKISDVFRYLPDPMVSNVNVSIDKINFFNRYGITSGDKVILVFGSIAPRKNIRDVISGFLAADLEATTLLILGSGDDVYVDSLNEFIHNVASGKCNRIRLVNEFVDHADIDAAFLNADAVIMAYKNFYGSSGVLGHAAACKTPVVATEYGLIHHLVNEYRLGVTISPTPDGIRKGLEQVMDEEYLSNFDPSSDYLSAKSVDAFVKTLLDF